MRSSVPFQEHLLKHLPTKTERLRRQSLMVTRASAAAVAPQTRRQSYRGTVDDPALITAHRLPDINANVVDVRRLNLRSQALNYRDSGPGSLN